MQAKATKIKSQTIFGESILNVIPIYDDENLSLSSPTKDKSLEDLESIKKKLETIKVKKSNAKEKVKAKTKKKLKKEIVKLKRKIP